VWTNEHSIATIIWALFENDEYFLTVVLFLFSIFFPFLKLFYLLTLVTSPDIPPEFRKKSISTMEWLGRYSMTDVMVLALMIFYVNSSGYTEATVLPGVYFFAASAIITMLAYGWANTVPVARRAPVASDIADGAAAVAASVAAAPSPAAGKLAAADDASHIVTLPTNPGRRHRPA
jgi:paraquat-inducible protein A